MASIVERTGGFIREVREEFRKVSRPTLPELRNSTTVVLISVAIMGLMTGAMDQVFALIIRFILK